MSTISKTSPYSILTNKLSNISALIANLRQFPYLSPHHLLIDSGRILEDVLVSTALLFLSNDTIDNFGPQLLIGSNLTNTIQSITSRLRDAEAISPQFNRDLEQIRKICNWLIISSSRHINEERAKEFIQKIHEINSFFAVNFERAQNNSVKSGILRIT